MKKKHNKLEQPPLTPREDIIEVRTVEGKPTDDVLAYEVFVPEGGDLYWDWTRNLWVVFVKKPPVTKKTKETKP